MGLALWLLLSSVGIELLLFVPGVWRARKVLAVTAAGVGVAAVVLLLAWQVNVFSVLLAFFAAYRCFNMARVVKGRMYERYLYRTTLRTSLSFAAFQAATVLLWLAWAQWHETGWVVWSVITSVQLVAAAGMLVSTVRNVQRTAWPNGAPPMADGDLPAVTVAIPARNETQDLQECLQTVTALDYPKLEVIVLDDCSQTRRTPEIIRSFANKGVRFVQGGPPSKTWLPKNWAYNRLAKEALGEYILFCGVDIRFSPDSVRRLMEGMLARHKQMVSVLPKRVPGAYGHASLLQAMRYWWELVPPRRFFNRPPVLSSCWIVRRQTLERAGGFAAVARSITPEAHFARVSVSMQDAYSFVRATERLGISSVKTVAEQRDTAIRTRYPQLHRKPQQVALHTLLEIGLLLAPFVLSIAGFFIDIGLIAHAITFITCALLVVTHELVVVSTRVNTPLFGLVAPPFMVLADIALLHYSMYKYEFSDVEWKNRNICIPAMHVVPHLPKV